jgi:hypothetical protein
MRHRLSFLLLAGLMVLGGCGGDPRDADASGDAGTAADAAAPLAGDDPLPPVIELAAQHLDPLARGLEAENDHLAQAVQRLQSADSDAAQLRALADIEAERLDGIGADAAGLEAHAYRRLRDALYEHLGAIETRAALEAQYGGLDTTGMDQATAAEARRQADEVMAAFPDPYADLDPALADALRQRQSELAALRATHIGLLFKAVDG